MDQSADNTAKNESLNYQPGCLTIVDTFRPPQPVATPTALALTIEPAADCARYDRLRPPPLAEEGYRGAA